MADCGHQGLGQLITHLCDLGYTLALSHQAESFSSSMQLKAQGQPPRFCSCLLNRADEASLPLPLSLSTCATPVHGLDCSVETTD